MKQADIALYRSRDGSVKLDVQLEEETVWLSQAQMSKLFGRDQSVISRHLRNVFREGELPAESNMQKMHISASDRPVAFHSLDVVISAGYRVKSKRGTEFCLAPFQERGGDARLQPARAGRFHRLERGR
jgi:hypothetical protein